MTVTTVNTCPVCGGSGEELSGVCHCGTSMEGHSLYDNHSATEMVRPCPECSITREKLIEYFSQEPPEQDCGEIREGRFCTLKAGHIGPHTYKLPREKTEAEKTIRKREAVKNPPAGTVLHCSTCHTPLTTKTTATETGLWCDRCCYPPPIENTYLAKPMPKLKENPDVQKWIKWIKNKNFGALGRP